MPADYARFMAGLDEAIRHGAEHRVTDTVKCVTGKEPRSLTEFAALMRILETLTSFWTD